MRLPFVPPRQLPPKTLKLHRRRRRQKLQISDLPTDILLLVTDRLPKSDCKSLRLVSRALYSFSSNLPLITELWFSPHSEDLTVFKDVCNHPFLGKHVTTVLYDITRFEDLSLEELRKRWPRPPRWARRDGKQKRWQWIEEHPGPWQYLKLVQEQNDGGLDEVRKLAEGLKRLPNVNKIKLGFPFQKSYLLTDSERLSPLWRTSDVQWMSRSGDYWKAKISVKQMGDIFESMEVGGVCVEELGFWQDDIRVPLSAFNFNTTQIFKHAVSLFRQLRSLSIQFSRSDLRSSEDISSFRELLCTATGMRKLHICIDGEVGTSKDRDELEALVGGTSFPRLQNLKIKGIYTSGEAMCRYLRRHWTTIQSLVLESVTFWKQGKGEWDDFWGVLGSDSVAKRRKSAIPDGGMEESIHYVIELRDWGIGTKYNLKWQL